MSTVGCLPVGGAQCCMLPCPLRCCCALPCPALLMRAALPRAAGALAPPRAVSALPCASGARCLAHCNRLALAPPRAASEASRPSCLLSPRLLLMPVDPQLRPLALCSCLCPKVCVCVCVRACVSVCVCMFRSLVAQGSRIISAQVRSRAASGGGFGFHQAIPSACDGALRVPPPPLWQPGHLPPCAPHSAPARFRAVVGRFPGCEPCPVALCPAPWLVTSSVGVRYLSRLLPLPSGFGLQPLEIWLRRRVPRVSVTLP